jgi:hypothetical protein
MSDGGWFLHLLLLAVEEMQSVRERVPTRCIHAGRRSESLNPYASHPAAAGGGAPPATGLTLWLERWRRFDHRQHRRCV